MKKIIMLLLLSAPAFAQTDPSTVGQLPNRADSFAVRQDIQSLLNYCYSHHLADFSFERGVEHCIFTCQTAQLVCAQPIQLITKPTPNPRGSSIVRAIRHRRSR